MSGSDTRLALLLNGKPRTTAHSISVDICPKHGTDSVHGSVPAADPEPVPTKYGLSQINKMMEMMTLSFQWKWLHLIGG